MAASSNIPESRFYSSPMKLFVVALLSSLKNLDNSTSRLTFRQQVHQPRIYAGAPAGVYVATVHAYDPDKPRKKVEYSLNNILDYKQFQVDKFSGNLSTALPVNKSVGEFYQVMVTAKTPGSSDLEHLEILVTEFNQFAPRFDHDRYTIQMHPRAKVGTVVLKVHATDRDNESHNSETYYLLDQNKTSQYFTLDSKKGELKLSQPITTNEPLQDFGIYAEDGGSPKRWAYVPVSIVMRALSEPRNVTIENVQHHEAKICWDPPEFGSIYGYTIKYYPFGSEGYFTFNTSSINKFGRMCENLTMLFDNVNYNLEIVGWNSRGEFGVKTEIFAFHTPEDFCKQKCAHGTCKELNREPWYECECPSGYSGQFCQAFDACSLHPCKNNGTCRNTNDNGYICICDGNYSGPSCGSFNPCLKSNPCENSGICEMTTNNTLICICAEGFYGRRCKYRDPCYNISCFNGGTCQVTVNGSYSCTCRNGFTGTHCETEIDECEKNPCSNGSTCLSKDGYFVCLCLDGFSGQTCEELEQCPSERTETDKGNFFWNSTNHSTEVSLRCPFGSLQSLPEAYAYRYCSLYEGFAVWGSVNASDCKTMEFLVADEVADELHSITKDPVSLNQETLEAASQGLSTISSFAAKDKKVAEGMVKVISNIMEVNDSIVVEDKNNSFTKLSENLLQVVDTLASNMELKPGESMTVNAPNVRVHSIEWNPEEGNDTNFNHIQLSAPKDRPSPSTDKQTSIFITDSPETVTPEYPVTTRSPEKPKVPMVKVFVPKEALQEAHRQLEGSVRVKFVVYYNDKLFQSKKVSKPDQEQSSEDVSTYVKIKKDDEEAELKAPVLQISVGNITLKNMYKPLVYILPLVTKREVLCVYWDEKDRRWSTEGLTTNHTKSYVICESSHMTAFSILFDVSPLSARDKTHESIMTIISYIGSILSIIGLSLTILTYMLFGCLNRDHPGKILTQLCFSLLLMNATYLLEAFVPSNGKDICAAIAMLLHYFVLSSLSWMCVEAINMYHLLVYVFGSSETHFMLKRCLFGWGVPFIFVAFTSIFELDSYYVGMEFCMLSPINKWIYYFAFLVPSCVIMGINFVIFLLVARVIFTPRLAANNDHPNVTIAQVRGAFTIMVLLGVTWVFGTLAFGRMKIGFQYAFCISNSVQGFLIFLVRCLLYPEARNSWVYLFKTGKLKKHRGVLPPGTVSFSTSQGPKNLNNASQSSTRATNEESPKIAFDGSLFNKNPEIMESCLILTPTSPGHISLEDFRGGSKEKFIECTPRFMHHNSPFLSKNDLNNFNLKKGRSASISVILDGDHENVASPSKLYTSMEFRSCEPSDKDKRSLSLDVSIPRPMLKKDVGAITKKAKTRITFKNRKSIGRKVQSDDEENSASTDVEDSPTSSVGLPCSDRAVAAPNSDASHKGGLNFQKQSYKKRFRSDDNMSVQNSALFPQPKRYF